MSTIIFVVSLLWPAPGPFSNAKAATSAVDGVVDTIDEDGPLRYRGIERLLARFEADAAQNR
jgi:hypothetical protein